MGTSSLPLHRRLCWAWLPSLLLAGSGSALAAAQTAQHVDEFPDLVHYQQTARIDQPQPASGCAMIRARRIDELEPSWQPLVERIQFDCEDVPSGDGSAGLSLPRTRATAYLKPGAARFAGIPVSEIHISEWDAGGVRQFVLAAPYSVTRPLLRHYLKATCGHSLQQLRDHTAPPPCTVEEDAQGLRANDNGETLALAQPDEQDPRWTRYVVAWGN